MERAPGGDAAAKPLRSAVAVVAIGRLQRLQHREDARRPHRVGPAERAAHGLAPGAGFRGKGGICKNGRKQLVARNLAELEILFIEAEFACDDGYGRILAKPGKCRRGVGFAREGDLDEFAPLGNVIFAAAFFIGRLKLIFRDGNGVEKVRRFDLHDRDVARLGILPYQDQARTCGTAGAGTRFVEDDLAAGDVEALDVAQRMNTRLAAALRTEADLKVIARRQKEFEAAVAANDHLQMSEANKQFHVAIAHAGKNPYLASFYERLLNQGQRMLHLHFEYLERTSDGYLLTDEHNFMLDAVRAKDVERADALAHAHTRQFQDSFIDFMRENYATDVALGPLKAAE